MKNNEFWFIIACLFLILPVAVIAGGNDDSAYEKEIPAFSTDYVEDYSDVFSCKYRLNISETVKSGYVGTFDFTINFSKQSGEVTSTNVTQISEISDLTDMTVNKLLVTTSISKIVYHSYGYSCPSLMVKLTEETDKDIGKENIIFNLANENSSQIVNTSSVYNSWLKVHNYYKTGYNCNFSNPEDCQNRQYCNWNMIDSGHKTYGCVEIEYGKEENIKSQTTRTDSCTGYVEPVFKQSVEYMFTVDGKLYVAEGAGDFAMFPTNNSNYVDKDNILYELWKNGDCCATDKLAISYSEDSVVVSCDGNGDWVYSGVNTNNYCKTEFDELASQLGIISMNITSENQLQFYNSYKKAAKCCKLIYSDLGIGSDSDDYKYCDKITGQVNDSNINLLNDWVIKDYFGNRIITGDIGTDCYAVLGSLGVWLTRIYKILLVAVPVIIVAFGFKDFIKALTAGKEDELKKAGSTFIKRLVFGAVFVALPIIVKVILTLALGGDLANICIL